MNLVVLTAALSSLNAGLYSTGRILRSMAAAGSAPTFAFRMSKSGVPWGGIVITAAVSSLGIPLNYILPAQAFEIVLSVAAVGVVTTWSTIILSQIQLYRRAKQGLMQRPNFRLFGAPYTGYAALLFLAFVLVMTFINSPWTMLVMAIASVLIVIGWFRSRDNILQIAREREGYTGAMPVTARPPFLAEDLKHE